MATEQNHRSRRPSKMPEGLQSTVAAPGHLKPDREAEQPGTEMTEVMQQSLGSTQQGSLPQIIQKGGKAEERRLPWLKQRLGSIQEMWLPSIATKGGSTQEMKLPPLSTKGGSTQGIRLPPLSTKGGSTQGIRLPPVTRRGSPEARTLSPLPQLADSSDSSCPKLPAALEQSSFEPVPSEVLFENYLPHKVYEATLVLRNKGRVPQWVKVIMETSPFFKLVGPKDVCQKVAPGMVSTYYILFTPDENKDYCHQLLCVTQREEFTVPIRAVGAQAVLDFPQQLNFSICPVKYSAQRTLLLRNLGEREAHYSISTQSPFSAEPCVGALGAGDAVQVAVEFLPLRTGEHRGALTLHCDSGEDIHSSLSGTAVDVNIRLDKSSLTMEKTYMSLCTQSTLLIHNGSDVKAHFQWKAAASEEEEEQQKQRLWGPFKPHPPKEPRKEPALQGRRSRLSRICQRQRAKAEGESLLCRSEEIFTIEPLEGEVWPHCSAEIQVTFKPQAARVYEASFYCDISGCEARLPLHIQGEGRGPWLCFRLEQLDIGQVLVGSNNKYEVTLHNKGAIHASFSLVPPTTALGSCFSFSPCQGLLLPDEFQVIQVCFCPTVLGHFTEEFRFSVKGSPEPVTLTVRGCVTAPTLHFDVPCLRFGDVSYGFPHSLSCRLTNASALPVAFALRVPGDGAAEPSVPSAAQVLDNSLPSWKRPRRRLRPCEFTISPGSGTIPALSFQDIQVTLCSNTLGTYKLALVVDVDGVGQELLSLPLTARCVVPALQVLSPVVSFGRCYLQLPAQQLLTLVNDSDLPGCYALLPQEQQEDAAVLYSSPVPCGIIQPHSSVEVPLMLEAQVPGEWHTPARVAVFGRARHPLEVALVSTGEGPVVSVQPSQVDFGSIQVLQEASRCLQLCNQSPIPAAFQAELSGGGRCWRVEPSQGVIPPEGQVSVCVTAQLDDTEQFQAEVQLLVEHSRGYSVPVRALGVGSTIVTDSPLAPRLSLGARFSLAPCCYSFRVTNRGRRTQRLCWSVGGRSPPGQRRWLPSLGSTKDKAASQSPAAACPVFQFRPQRMELSPGQTMEVVLEGFCSTPQVVREQLLCHAVVGNEARSTQIMQAELSCQFVAPALQISSPAITFQVEKQAGDVLTPLAQPLSLKNICPLPLSMVLALGQPFSLCDVEQQPLPADAQPIKLEAGQELTLCISFNPAHEEGLSSWQVEQALRIHFLEHPHEEQVLLRGEVYFPNLHFQSMVVDFGCILNDTGAMQSLQMTNCSPLPVHYCWQLLPDSQGSQLRCSLPAPAQGACRRRWASAGSSSRAGGVEEPARALGAAGDPAQQPADAKDSLEAELLSSAVELGGAVAASSPSGIKQLMKLEETEPLSLGLEEVFDVLPLQGLLQPGQSQQLTFSFFGHPNIVACARALCRVQGGPSYEVRLRGEASLISYLLDTTELDVGPQPWDRVTEVEVTLQNSGKLPFPFVVLSPGTGTACSPLPGVPLVVPSTGGLGAGQQQLLKVSYLPGAPGAFCKTFQLQVGHLEPEEVSLKGVGSFPRICLDLPRHIQGNEKYEKAFRKVKGKMAKDSERDGEVVLGEAAATEPPPADLDATLDPGLQMQLEDILLKEHILEQQAAVACSAPEEAALRPRARRRLLRAELPEHVLDFGWVALGGIHRHTVKVTNPGPLPVSFQVRGQVLSGTGFSVDLGLVKQLPCSQSRTFTVCLEPQSAALPLGEADVLLPIQVAGGPTFHVLLRARVAVPSLSLSRDRLEFSAVQCGQCQEETIRLYNQLPVPCQWFLSRDEPAQKVDEALAASRRGKLLQELKAKASVFEVLPSAGVLDPGQCCKLQVRFSPVEEKPYMSQLKLNICQSSQHLQLLVSGSGLEPRLEFHPEELELGPVLPASPGAQGTVVVKNPCEFPIEFYSLDFEQQCLAEEQVLDELGLGPSGPPIPPTAACSVVCYPDKREVPAEVLQHFVLLPEEEEAPGSGVDVPTVPTVKTSAEQGTPARGHLRREKASSSQGAVRGKQSSGCGRRDLQGPATGPSRCSSEGNQSQGDTLPPPERCARRSSYRWVVPARGQVALQVHFSSAVLGSFEQRLHFELLGTKRAYQLLCRGTCLHPTISQDPREVFPRCRKSKAADAIISKEYVLSTGVFHFGPLLCGKARDRSKAVLQAGNCEKISIRNVSPWEAEVHFSFERGGSGGTFLLEPASMQLGAKEKQELSIWAYPTSAGLVEDSLICCIKGNPEPVVFHLCCQGVQVKLGVSPKQLHFDRVLLHSEHSRSLLLRNSCPLPVAWRLSGLESLGEGFSVSQSEGTVGPRSELAVQLCFRTTKALSVEKKIRLEVSDAENVQGVVQVENIEVLAEAYEVALNITLPEGADGCVNFGVLKVLGSAKQVLSLRNQGQYKIAYRFRLCPTDPRTRDLASHLTVQPQQGLLPASEHPVSVQLLFHPQREISIEDEAILLCQVLEPTLSAGGEPIATIPVRLSGRAVFSQYSISPAALLDCGAVASGTRRACSFLLQNRGLLPFEFLICRAEQDAAEPTKKRMFSESHKQGSFHGRSAAAKQNKPLLPEETKPSMKAGFPLGMFTVSPALGSILPGEQQLVTVDCAAGLPGPCQEQLVIDISNRDPKDNPLGIPYTLLAESCLPAFLADDIESIFEGHQICSSSSNLCQVLQTVQEEQGVFLTDENKFIFTNVLVGHQARARFKICNVNRIPCEVLLSIKPSPKKLKSHSGQVFEVAPVRLSVPSCSHAFATVTFAPRRVKSYRCTFEASLDVHTSHAAVRAQSLTFEISGEGKLPEVSVLRPALKDRRGNPLLLFRRLLLGAWEKLPLLLQNSGAVPAQVLLDLLDEEGVFFLKARPTTKCLYQPVGMKDSAGEERKLHTASLLLQCGETAELEVFFKPTLAQRLEGKLHLAVLGNPSETTIRLVGEGHEDDFTLDNIQGLVTDKEEQNLPEGSLEEDSIEADPGDHIQFGFCAVGTPSSVTFTIANRHRGQALRFLWLPEPPFHFSPQVGHLHAGCAKDITVTLHSEVEVTFKKHPVKCQVSRISFQLPPEEVPDWDDSLHAIKWVDTTRPPGASWPVKKKVLEPEVEPAHTVLESSSHEVQILLSAVVTGSECAEEVIN